MKLMWAKCCSNIVVPYGEDLTPRHCSCGRAAVWWEDGEEGKLVVTGDVEVLGLHNGLLTTAVTDGVLQKEQIEKLIDNTPEYFLFKKVNSLIIKFAPGATGDTRLTGVEELEKLEEKQREQIEFLKSLGARRL